MRIYLKSPENLISEAGSHSMFSLTALDKSSSKFCPFGTTEFSAKQKKLDQQFVESQVCNSYRCCSGVAGNLRQNSRGGKQ